MALLGVGITIIAAFALIFVRVVAVGGAVAALLAKLLRVVGLRCLDRLAGGFLSFVRGVVIAIVAIMIIMIIMVMMAFTAGPPPAAVKDSRFAPHLLWASTFIARMAPAELRDAYQASRRKLLDAGEENIARSNTFLTQSGRRRVPGVARCAAGSLPLTSEGGAVWANERTCGSVWGY